MRERCERPFSPGPPALAPLARTEQPEEPVEQQEQSQHHYEADRDRAKKSERPLMDRHRSRTGGEDMTHQAWRRRVGSRQWMRRSPEQGLLLTHQGQALQAAGADFGNTTSATFGRPR